MSEKNTFMDVVNAIHEKLAQERRFAGFYLSPTGSLKFLRNDKDEIEWYSSCDLIQAEMLKQFAKTPALKKCGMYAMSFRSYITGKLLINCYERSTGINITPQMLLPFNIVALDFHKNSAIGMFMPMEYHMKQLHARVRKEPSQLFRVAGIMKRLITEESKPCVSCGVLCHVPDVDDSNLENEYKQKIQQLTEDGRGCCIRCGGRFLANVAKYKMTKWADSARIHAINTVLAKIEKIDILADDFSFEDSQSQLTKLMELLSDSSVTVIDTAGEKGTSVRHLPGQPEKKDNPDKPNIPDYFN